LRILSIMALCSQRNEARRAQPIICDVTRRFKFALGQEWETPGFRRGLLQGGEWSCVVTAPWALGAWA